MSRPTASPVPVRFGVMGCAGIAVRRMLPAMAALPDTAVAAVASREAKKAEDLALSYDCHPVTGYADLLERDDVEAVYVPLPTALHATWVEAALRAGKHVLAEKPLTTDPGTTRSLLALARSRGLVLRENVMFVHHAQHAAVRRLLDQGAIGQLRAFQAAFTIPQLSDDDIRYQPELAGGALFDVGVYPLRAALHLLGDSLTVVGATLTTGAGRRVDTAGAALLRTADCVTAQLTFGMEHAYRSAYELCGSEGRITVEPAFTPPADHRPVVRVARRSGVEEVRLEADDQVANTLAAFARAVRAGAFADDTHDTATLSQATLVDEVRRVALRAP